MSATQLDPVGAGYHPSVGEMNAEVEETDNAHDHLDLLDTRTKETEGADDYNDGSESEKGRQYGIEKQRHVGFWSHELVNVRLHVIKLWIRTGESSIGEI